ncbi:MAG: hypothetical protein AB1847_13060 [bacterium]
MKIHEKGIAELFKEVTVFRRKSRKEVSEYLDFLLESQYWPLDKLKRYQWEKLKKILEYSYENIPYYHELFQRKNIKPQDIQTPHDLHKIPILTKSIIQENIDDLVSNSIDKSQIILNSTGGSTGTPLNFYQDQSFVDWADAARTRAWKYFPGLEKDEFEAVLWGSERDIGKGLNLSRVLYYALREGNLNLNTFDLDSQLIKKYFLYFWFMKPRILRGYASSLFYIAKFIEENNIRINYPQSIVSTAECLWPSMREKIEQVFNAKIYNSYGCREVSQIATECEEHKGLHIVMENQYVEVIDNDIIVTNLNNYAMPFIRYKIGDMAQGISEEPCACGRNSSRLIDLMGRDNENIVLEDKKVINAIFFQYLFFGNKSVEKFQVIYFKKVNKLQIRLQLSSESEEILEIIRKKIYNNFKFNNIEIVKTREFVSTPSGKFRFVFSMDE